MKKLAATFLILVLFIYIAIYFSLQRIPVTAVYDEYLPAGTANEYRQLEKDLFDFIGRNLLKPDGEIITNVQKYDGSGDTLSESVGFLMNYCVATGKKELFDRELMFLKNRMLVDGSFIKWRVGKNAANCNAAVDDLRIIRALLDAYDKWGLKEYLDLAGFLQQGLYDMQVSGRDLCEFYDWVSEKSRFSVPLCYLDLYTIDRVSDFNTGWLSVEENALSVINSGMAGTSSPFYFKYYDYDTRTYSADEEFKKNGGICLTYTLLTAIHKVEVNEDTGILTQWLKGEMEKGKLFAWYDPRTLKPADNMESTAVYALAAVYAYKTGENALYSRLVSAMKKFLVTDRKSVYYGGFGIAKSRYFHSFDNLTALWALSLADE